MRLIERLTGRSSLDDSYPYASSGLGEFMMTSFGVPDNEQIQPGYTNATNAYGTNGVVFSAILRRLNLFAEAEFKWQRLDDRSLFGTPDLAPLETPWPNGSTGELLARMEQDVSLAGNAYVRDAGSQLERLRPDWTSIVSEVVRDPATDTQVRRVVGYWYDPRGEGDRDSDLFPVGEVAHWSPIPDPLANFRGMSWLTPVLRDVDADTKMTDFKRAYLENAATPNLLIKYPEKRKIGDASMTRLVASLQARHGGVRNAFKTLVLDEGADATVIGDSLDKAAYSAVQKAGENRIIQASGVPPMLVGGEIGLDASTLANFGMAWRTFSDGTMRPNWRSACAALSRLVPAPAGARLWFDTSQIAALQEGEKEKADTMAVLATAANGFVTAGFTPDSIKAALASSDITLLQHSGLVSVQLQRPGTSPGAPAPDAPQGGDA